MKSIKPTGILKCLTFIILISFCLNHKVNSKKSHSVMEFFNDLFLGNSNSNNNKNLFESSSGEAPSGSAPAPSGSAPAPSGAAPSNSTEAGNLKLSDWLQVSSNQFKSKSRYPAIYLPDGKEIKMNLDKNFFRINDAFDTIQNKETGPWDNKYFWFRLSGSHLYYTSTKDDVNVLDAISVDNIIDTKDNNDPTKYCFYVTDNQQTLYQLCAHEENTKTEWACAIKRVLGKSMKDCTLSILKANVNLTSTIIEETNIQPIILIPLPSKKCNEGWTYAQAGTDWECTCSEGQEQSPIDLPQASKALSSPITPLFQYENVEAKSPITSLDGQVISEQYIKIKFFQNALRIFHPNLGKIVTLDGAMYIAEEIVFHTPSEHTIDGKRYDMEMQVIHYGQTQGDIAKQVVLSFLFEKKAGVYNKFMDDVDFFSLPNKIFKERDITNNLYIPKIFYSSDDSDIVVIKPFSFYTYQGSITFPPCTERTIHYVASNPIPISSSLLELMKEALRTPDSKDEKGNYYMGEDKLENYRNTQPLNDRPVFYFDHTKYCGDEKAAVPKVKPEGHYEKIPKKVTEYFYVNGDEPSGLPGAFVVNENEAKGTVAEDK
jgi:carbonic anhydrase